MHHLIHIQSHPPAHILYMSCPPQKLDGELEAVAGGGTNGDDVMAQMNVTAVALAELQTFVEGILV